MVFPGRFSTGCKRCRQRKVKCDEGRPSCRRCQIYGKPCPGYADQFHFRFDKTASKQKPSPLPQPRREWSRAPHHPQPLPQSATSGLAILHPTGKVRPPTILPQPGQSYDDISLYYFMNRFVTPDENDNLPGHLSFLPGLYSQDDHGLLGAATLSVAQMAAYNQFGSDKFRIQSYQNYGRAVRALRQTIQSEDQVTDDRVLAAVLLLCMFKDIGEDGWGDPSEHVSGLYYLVEKRGMEQCCTNTGAELFFLAFLKLQVHSFVHQDFRYSDPGGFIRWLSPFNPMVGAMSLMTTTLLLRKDLLQCINRASDYDISNEGPSSSGQERSDDLDQSILRAAFEALQEFDNWDNEVVPYWKNTFGDRGVPAPLGEFQTAANYHDPKTAVIIILIRTARLILLSSILEYYGAMQASYEKNKAWRVGDPEGWANCIPFLEKTIRLAVDDMIHCVSFALGDLNPNDGSSNSIRHDGAVALVVFQSVRLVTYCAYATPEQRESGKDLLQRMKTAIGVRSAIPWEEQVVLLNSAPQQTKSQGLLYALSKLDTKETVDAPQTSC
ncbi:hypothetical protein F4777DRAFT_566027 [Nemania sp. FL0916]|nr:hypothetical protein F4777DRAFT_566027 [Nemania sp. FL0916]